jgi:hypothetical protein
MRQALPQPKVSIWSRIFKKDSSNEINSWKITWREKKIPGL